MGNVSSYWVCLAPILLPLLVKAAKKRPPPNSFMSAEGMEIGACTISQVENSKGTAVALGHTHTHTENKEHERETYFYRLKTALG